MVDPSVPAPALPIQRLAAVASAADPGDAASFKPRSVHHAVAGALFGLTEQSESCPAITTFTELAVASGITIDQMRKIIEDPPACAWIVARAAGIAKLGLAAVYARLQHMALTSKNSNWALLFLRRFDPEFQRQSSPAQFNMQLNQFADYSDQELLAHVKHKRRQRGLDRSEPAESA